VTKHREYACNKLAAYPDLVRELQVRRAPKNRLISVHLMPQNRCNQHCEFCSYRMPNNRNADVFDPGESLSWGAMKELLADFRALGVRGVEVTGGGEPLAYPHTDKLWREFAKHGFATALVTNGTPLRDRAPIICSTNLKWARVSIDCSKLETYVRMRMAPEGHFKLAWDAVAQLREHAPKDPEFRLGVGFVLCNENMGEVYDFVARAKDSGADNVRLSVTYPGDGDYHFQDFDALGGEIRDAERAEEDFADENFAVHNLMAQRWREVVSDTQLYRRCVTQEILCVVEGSGHVYTCCTFTGSKKGDQGVFWQHPEGFLGLWRDKALWRSILNPMKYCQNACLYESRNREMLAMLAKDAGPLPCSKGMIHTEFI